MIEWKRPLLEKACAAFEAQRGRPARREAFQAFVTAHAAWLPDFALFTALKRANGGAAWNTWERPLVEREPEALERARRELARECREVEFAQWLFFEQWAEVRRAARERGIRLMGDVPIFVAHDSADVWAHPELFHLDARRPAVVRRPACRPTTSAPPASSGATRSTAGTRSSAPATPGGSTGCARVFELVDLVRLDHFRGFEAYWEVAGDATTAVDGRWVKGPGRRALRGAARSARRASRSWPRTWA